MSDNVKALEQEFVTATAKTLASHAATIERLATAVNQIRQDLENLNEHVNKLAGIWNQNLTSLGALVNEQSRAITALNAVVTGGPVN